MRTRFDFSARLLRDLGMEDAGLGSVVALLVAMQFEGDAGRNNPLNVTMPWTGATDFNSDHVKNYRSFHDGVDATAKILRQDNYQGIRDALRGGNTQVILAAWNQAGSWTTIPDTVAAEKQIRNQFLFYAQAEVVA